MQIVKDQAQYQHHLREQKDIANKMDIKQTITYDDFEVILTLVKGTNKKRIASLLVFKVSHLLLLTQAHGKQLFEDGKTNRPIIKMGFHCF